MRWFIGLILTIVVIIFLPLYVMLEPTVGIASIIITVLGIILGVVLNLKQKK